MSTTTAAKYTPKATLTETTDGIDLIVTWAGPEPLDRPSTGGWGFGKTAAKRALAVRLARAINAGVAYGPAKVVRDVNGNTYIDANTVQFFHGRHMDKSLKAVGF